MIKITFVSPIEDVNPDDDTIDVHVHLDDGRTFSFLVATPKNIYRSMNNEGIDHYFGTPPLFVREITSVAVERAIQAILLEDNRRWLYVYGVLQTEGNG